MKNIMILGLLVGCNAGQSVDSGVHTADDAEMIIEVAHTTQSQTTGPDGWVTLTITDVDNNMHLLSCVDDNGSIDAYVNTDGPETLDFKNCLSYEDKLFTKGTQIWFKDGQVTAVYSADEAAEAETSKGDDRP